ncbi:MAG: spermidine synthase [Planctomycetota bacterium]|jgi:spermidine synthase
MTTKAAETIAPKWMPQRVQVLVFVAGASLMALQIAGSRVIAPHFGSSLFIWGGLIGVFLLALSAGYFLGGWAGDKHPHIMTLGLALGGAGILFLFIPHMGIPVCIGLKAWGPRWGPLASAIILFVLPSILLGSASPIAVRLFTKTVEASGRAAGSLYALSTFGSLTGTFLATFVLVPLMGTPALIMTLGAVLVAVPLLVMPKNLGLAMYGVPVILASLIFITSPTPEVPLAMGESRQLGHVLFETETPYHRIFVVEGKEEGRDTRYLQFDHYIESGISATPPHHSVTHYTDLMHISSVFNHEPKGAVFVGGGGMVGPRTFDEVYKTLDRIDVIELDAEVVRVAKEYFFFQPTNKMHVAVGDARIFVAKSENRWDVAVLDAYTAGGRVPFHLLTREFFDELKAHMTSDGVVILNIIGAMVGPKSKVFRGTFKTLETVFPQVYAFPRVRHRTGSERESDDFRALLAEYATDPEIMEKGKKESVEHVRNIFVAASMDPKRVTVSELKRRAKDLVDTDTIPARFHVLDHVSGLAPSVQTDDLPVLTDDFAPVEQWKTW